MKKILSTLLVVLLSTSLFAQEEPQYVYCQVVGTTKLFSRKVTITIDFGQHMNFFADNRLRDLKTGKKKVFNSMIDALNYMGKKGWEFEQAYVVSTDNQNVHHYLMKKAFNKFDKEAKLEFLKDE